MALNGTKYEWWKPSVKHLSVFWAHICHSAVSWPLSVTSWLFGTLLVTQCPFWLLSILAIRCSYGCLALSLTTRRPPGRIGRKNPKSIDAAQDAALFRHAKPSVCAFPLAVKCGCWVITCPEVGQELWKLSREKRDLAKLHIKWHRVSAFGSS